MYQAYSFCSHFLPVKHHLVGVDHDDVVAVVDVGRVGGAILAHQDHRQIAGQAPDDFVAGIDQPPLRLDLAGPGHVGFHLLHVYLLARLPGQGKLII